MNDYDANGSEAVLSRTMCEADREEFAQSYVSEVSNVFRAIDWSVLARVMEVLETAHCEGRTLFIAGNGGSASTARYAANGTFAVMATTVGDKLGGGASTLTAAGLTRSLQGDRSWYGVPVRSATDMRRFSLGWSGTYRDTYATAAWGDSSRASARRRRYRRMSKRTPPANT